MIKILATKFRLAMEKMLEKTKNFILELCKYNTWLAIGAVVSLLILIVCLLLKCYKLRYLFIELTIGYLVAYLFHIFQVFIPEQIKIKKALLVLQGQINSLFMTIKPILQFWELYIETSGDSIVCINSTKEVTLTVSDDGRNAPLRFIQIKVLDLLSNFNSQLEHKITLLKAYMIFKYLPDSVQQIISEIEVAEFPDTVSRIANLSDIEDYFVENKIGGTAKIVPDLQESYKAFCDAADRLEKITTNKYIVTYGEPVVSLEK